MKAWGKIKKSRINDKEGGVLRIWKKDDGVPGITITRSIGDLIAHEIGLLSEPEVTWKQLNQDDKCMVISSSRVWEVISSTEVVSIIFQISDMEKIAEKTEDECRERWERLNDSKIEEVQSNLDAQDDDSIKKEKNCDFKLLFFVKIFL